jgi:hypothetical protein
MAELQPTFRDDSADQEEVAAKARGAERERIARAIMDEGEFMSEELKEFRKEVETMHGLATGLWLRRSRPD